MQGNICIHIGLHKTGTTTLQKWVFPKLKNHNTILRDKLEDFTNQIIYFPDFTLNDSKIKFYRNKFLSLNKNILISEENLSGSPTLGYSNRLNAIKNLSLVFPEAKIIVSIREQKSLIISLYRHYVRQGGTKSFKELLNFKIKSSGLNYVLPETYFYSHLLEQLSNYFNEKNILFLPLELINEKTDTYMNYIENFLDDKFDKGININKKENSGIAPGSEFFLKYLNRFRSSKNNAGFIPRSDWLFYKLASLSPKIDIDHYSILNKYNKHFIDDNLILQNKINVKLPLNYFN